MMKICVIFNPAARGEKAQRFREHLAMLSTQCVLKPTYAAGAGHALAAEAVREGFEIIVAAGGDGTVNEVLNGIGDEPEGFSRACLGVLPLGTINVFARELNLPSQFTPAWDVIQRRREDRIDLPQVEYTAAGQTHRRYFAQMAGAGWDSQAIDLVNWEQKKKIGALAYVVAGLKALRGPLPKIIADGGQSTLAGELVLIGNGRFYGGSYSVFPLADLRDGLLEVTVFPRVNWEAMLRAGWGLLSNQLYQSGGARHFKAESLTLSSAAPVSFHVEGENVGHLPASFRVRHLGLRALVP